MDNSIYKNLVTFLVVGFLFGVAEGLMLYADHLTGLGGWYWFALNVGLLYAVFFAVPFWMISLWVDPGGKSKTYYAFSGLMTVFLGARIYRLHFGELVDTAMLITILVCLSVILFFSLVKIPDRWRWFGFLPFLGVIVIWATSIVWYSPEPALSVTEPESKHNVIWIISDTLRSDHLSQYGYRYRTFKEFEDWQDDFVRFENSYSQSSWTPPGVASYMTSLYPFQHGKSIESKMHEDVVTVPQILRRAGYTTYAISNNNLVSPVFGFGRGFDWFYAPASALDHSTFVDILDEFEDPKFMAWFTSKLVFSFERFQSTTQSPEGLWQSYQEVASNKFDEPFFLYLHFFDPHAPYNPDPKWYPSDVPDVESTKFYTKEEEEIRAAEYDPDTVADIRRRYDGEINDVADKVDKILSSLKRRGLYEDSLVLFTSDHGEELNEYGHVGHGSPGLTQEVTRVPLFVKFPERNFERSSVTFPVQGLDLIPTTLNSLGMEIDLDYEMQGESIVSSEGLLGRNRPILSQRLFAKEGFRESVIRKNGYQVYMREPYGKGKPIFRVKDDPRIDGVSNRETLPDTHNRLIDRMLRTGSTHDDFKYQPRYSGKTEREQLEGLGYIQ